jgi:hypothetical protein
MRLVTNCVRAAAGHAGSQYTHRTTGVTELESGSVIAVRHPTVHAASSFDSSCGRDCGSLAGTRSTSSALPAAAAAAAAAQHPHGRRFFSKGHRRATLGFL